MDKSQARFLIGVMLALFIVFGIGYFGGVPNLARGAATSLTGFGAGIVGMAIRHISEGGAS